MNCLARNQPARRRLQSGAARAKFVAAPLLGALLAGCATVKDTIYDGGVAVARYAAGVSVERVETPTRGRLAYLHREGTGPTLVFLHGFAAQKDVWLRLLRMLPRNYGVVAIDLPGHGESDRDSTARYRTRDFTEALEEALARIGLERFHLLGSSLGGKIALCYARRHPERVLSLGLISPAAFHPPEPSELEERIAAQENPLFVEDREDFERLMDLLFYKRPFMPWPIASVLTRRFADDRDHRERMWRDMWEHRREMQEELEKLTMPVFLLWGKEDRVVDVSAVQAFREQINDVPLEVVILEKTGHSPMVERPREVAEKYVQFLDSQGAKVNQ